MTHSSIAQAIERRLQGLPQGLREHIYRVRELAADLARHHAIDAEKAWLGASGHDIMRAVPVQELLERARALGLPVTDVDQYFPVLLHGPVAAETLRREDGLADPEVYEAIYWHSTARRDLGPVGKVVFLADKLDPHKSDRYSYGKELASLARRDLDSALRMFLDWELKALLEAGRPIHPAAIEARNQLLLRLSPPK